MSAASNFVFTAKTASAPARRSRGKKRTACSRCHNQKLRCIRTPGSEVCDRCVRLGTVCHLNARIVPGMPAGPPTVFSLQSRLITAPLSSQHGRKDDIREVADTVDDSEIQEVLGLPSQLEVCEHEDPSVDTHRHAAANCPLFRDLDLSILSGVEGQLDEHCHKVAPITIADADEAETNFRDFGRRLTSLDLFLLNCHNKLLPSTASNARGGDSNGNFGSSARTLKYFVIEDLFNLTSEFIDIVTGINLMTRGRSRISASGIQTQFTVSDRGSSIEAMYAETSGLGAGSLEASERGCPRSTDHTLNDTTILLIASCHCQLADMYVSLLQRMRTCLQWTPGPRLQHDWGIELPRLQLGSFDTPALRLDGTEPLTEPIKSVYMSMVAMLSYQLWRQLRDIFSPSLVLSQGYDPRAGLLLQDAYHKSHTVVETIDAVKCLIK